MIVIAEVSYYGVCRACRCAFAKLQQKPTSINRTYINTSAVLQALISHKISTRTYTEVSDTPHIQNPVNDSADTTQSRKYNACKSL